MMTAGVRKRRNYCLDQKYIDRLRERAAQRDGGNLSRAVERAIDEADGNAQALRHDVRRSLNAILLSCVEVRASTRHPNAVEAADAIDRAVQAIDRLLQWPPEMRAGTAA